MNSNFITKVAELFHSETFSIRDVQGLQVQCGSGGFQQLPLFQLCNTVMIDFQMLKLNIASAS